MTAAQKMTVEILSPSGKVDFTCNFATDSPCATNLTADETGVYILRATKTLGSNNPQSYWKFAVSDAGGEIKGRIWSDVVWLVQDNADSADINLWAVNNNGAIYKISAKNYMGASSFILSNSAGAVENGTCTSTYKSYGFASNPTPQIFNAQVDAMLNCGAYRLFYENPAADLPETAPSADGEIPVLPELNDDVSFGSNIYLARAATDAADNTIMADLSENFAGNFWVEIDTDGDGIYNEPNDTRVSVGAPMGAKNHAISASWDGKDGNGNLVPLSQTVNSRLYIDKSNEIHFAFFDVEQLAGGLTITRLNGGNAGSDTLYWDDSDLGCRTQSLGEVCGEANLTGISSAGGVHAWPSNPSLGDFRLIDNWTYAAGNLNSASQANVLKYYVDFDNLCENSANCSENPAREQIVILTGDETATEPKNPTREGFDFDFYYDCAGNFATEFDFATKISADVQLCAHWTPKNYQIIYQKNAENARGNMQNSVATFSEDAQTSQNSFSRLGYTFKNWNSKPDGSGTNFANNYKFSPYNVAKNTTLYAIWQINSYEISFDLLCEKNEICDENPPTQTVDFGNSAKNPSENSENNENPTRENQIFKGWQICEKSGENSFTGENVFYDFSAKITENVELCAVWNPEFLVEFTDENGEIIKSEKVENEKSATAPNSDEIPARNGEKFVGWDKKFDKITGNLTVVAIYEKLPAEIIPTAPATGIWREKFVKV